MKAAIIGAKYTGKGNSIYEKIKKSLEMSGAKVDFSYFSTTVKQDAENLAETYKRNMKLIKGCDFLIAETTDFSSGIGYLIANALNEKKPVLALFDKDSGKTPSNTIKSSAQSKMLKFVEYSPKDLDKKIQEFNVSVKSILDTKFILIISPQIDRYLEWASSAKRMHKAQIVREAVEEMMKKDKDWKKMDS